MLKTVESQVVQGTDLYHYELVPQKFNGRLLSGENVFLTSDEISEDNDIFDPISEKLDGNSQFYRCLLDLMHYCNQHKPDALKTLLVISDMDFDGLGEKDEPLKNPFSMRSTLHHNYSSVQHVSVETGKEPLFVDPFKNILLHPFFGSKFD